MAKCTVKFQRDPVHGNAALLRWQGRVLNAINYPRGHKITVAEGRRAKRILMAGCDELVRVEQRGRRRRR